MNAKSPDHCPELQFRYINHRGENALRRVLPIRVWHGSTDWYPQPQWLLRAFDLDRGGERDFAFASINPPKPAATEGDAIGLCEGCSKPIHCDDPHHSGWECLLCAECAPSFADMLAEPQSFIDLSTGEPLTSDAVRAKADAHLAAGGKLEDKVL